MATDLGRVRAVLFDAVGTLVRPDPPVADAYHAAGRRFGSRLDREVIRHRFAAALARHAAGGPTSEPNERIRWQRVVAEVFHDVPAAASDLFAALWDHFASPAHWRVYDDVAEAWRALEARGYILGIASNFDDRLAGICAGSGPLARCKRFFLSSRVGFAKPDARFYAAVERELGLPAEKLLLVGDDPLSDVAAPRAAGWQALLIDRGGEPREGAIAGLGELTGRLGNG
jgi:putative hydrolase of the HAD superfamily